VCVGRFLQVTLPVLDGNRLQLFTSDKLILEIKSFTIPLNIFYKPALEKTLHLETKLGYLIWVIPNRLLVVTLQIQAIF